jgi:glycosyltransferase involved in cell wall biosynthesis
MNPKDKLLVFSGNPTQYHSPLFREIEKQNQVCLEVLFGDEIGGKSFYSEEFASEIKWDVPVLEGYKFRFFKNLSSSKRKGFFSRNNPSIVPYVLKSDAKFVLIHGYDTLTSWYVYFASLISFKKIIWRGEAVEPVSTKTFISKLKILIKSAVLPVYFWGCYKVLYSCKLNKKYLENYVRNKNKLISFPCSVDNKFFQENRIVDPKNINTLKKSLNIPLENTIITTCSRLTKRKRTMKIIETISEMDTKKITMLIIGDGPERINLETAAKKFGVSCVCVGFVGQHMVAKLLSISDIFILISEYDASPKALNEAMNFPLAMISSEGVGTCIDLIHENKNGFILKNHNLEKLLDCLNYLVNNKDRLNMMGAFNEKIIADYSYDKGINNIFEVINDYEKN